MMLCFIHSRLIGLITCGGHVIGFFIEVSPIQVHRCPENGQATH
jgi:hypothetical protein